MANSLKYPWEADTAELLKIIQEIQKNRRDRLSTVPHLLSSISSSDETEAPDQTCFSCRQIVDADLMASHVIQCLGGGKFLTGVTGGDKDEIDDSFSFYQSLTASGYEDEGEIYTIGGQTRIRTCSLLPNGYAGLRPVQLETSAPNGDEEVVVDGDDVEYGETQYTEANLASVWDDGTVKDEERTLRMMLSPQQTPQSHQSEAVKTDPDPSWKCMVCLDTYITPVISVNCWHTHCETCWLKTLASKRLCPQCGMITSPSALRKIFL